jgi:hypothetical protein
MSWLMVFLLATLALILGFVGIIAWFMPKRYFVLRKRSSLFRGLTGSSKMDIRAKPEENLWGTRITTAIMVPILIAGAYGMARYLLH